MIDDAAIYTIKSAKSVDWEIAGEVIAELLTDVNWETTDMFYYLADNYLAGSPDVKKGIDVACSILTGYHLDTIAQKVLDRADEYDDGEDEYEDDEDGEL